MAGFTWCHHQINWEALSAVSTFAAVVVALWLPSRTRQLEKRSIAEQTIRRRRDAATLLTPFLDKLHVEVERITEVMKGLHPDQYGIIEFPFWFKLNRNHDLESLIPYADALDPKIRSALFQLVAYLHMWDNCFFLPSKEQGPNAVWYQNEKSIKGLESLNALMGTVINTLGGFTDEFAWEEIKMGNLS